MVELVVLLLVVVAVVLLIRPRLAPPLDQPLVVVQSGRFHATLAPQLEAALPLLEAISQQVQEARLPAGDSGTLYFRVQDNAVAAPGLPFYLLALTRRENMLYFQAIQSSQAARAPDAGGYHATLTSFSAAVMESVPQTTVVADVGEKLGQLAARIATERGVTMARLLPGQ